MHADPFLCSSLFINLFLQMTSCKDPQGWESSLVTWTSTTAFMMMKRKGKGNVHAVHRSACVLRGVCVHHRAV